MGLTLRPSQLLRAPLGTEVKLGVMNAVRNRRRIGNGLDARKAGMPQAHAMMSTALPCPAGSAAFCCSALLQQLDNRLVGIGLLTQHLGLQGLLRRRCARRHGALRNGEG